MIVADFRSNNVLICQCINMLMWQYVNMPIDRVLFRMAIGISAHGHIDTLLIGCFEFFQEAGIVFRE